VETGERIGRRYLRRASGWFWMRSSVAVAGRQRSGCCVCGQGHRDPTGQMPALQAGLALRMDATRDWNVQRSHMCLGML